MTLFWLVLALASLAMMAFNGWLVFRSHRASLEFRSKVAEQFVALSQRTAEARKLADTKLSRAHQESERLTVKARELLDRMRQAPSSIYISTHFAKQVGLVSISTQFVTRASPPGHRFDTIVYFGEPGGYVADPSPERAEIRDATTAYRGGNGSRSSMVKEPGK